jgi:tRNA threonylcarbamoyladenosine biosynthesis protein TsaE
MHKTILATSPDATAELARQIGARLSAGDVLLLSGEIGAGKTHFARSLILSLLDAPEDVPSPTFTLVQTYQTQAGEIWHTDLYRLTDPDEAVELGLDEAFETAICLVEWPDRLDDLTPAKALSLGFEARDDDSRTITLSASDASWDARLHGVMA